MISLLWGKIQTYVIAAVAGLGFLLTIYLKGRSDQKSSSAVSELKDRAENLKKAKDVNEKVHTLSDADVDAELRKSGWMRNTNK